jgi:hypothetical protein
MNDIGAVKIFSNILIDFRLDIEQREGSNGE